MKLTMLGTGNALVTECYNTCFVIEDKGQYFMVDAGGGNTVLTRLKDVGINWKEIRHIFVTHKHIDHVMGIIWMVRLITQKMSQGEYEGEAYIYGHQEVLDQIQTIAELLLQKKTTAYIGKRLHLVAVADQEEKIIIGHKMTFFDIQSTKAKQFGFSMYLNETERLTCCGDEPYRSCEETYVKGSKWLLHEAFCLYSQADTFKPYEKNHSTVKDACELAENFHIPNLLLYHTEDKNIARRKELYGEEGRQYYTGQLYIPEDFEQIEL